jgi:hypothetical protein
MIKRLGIIAGNGEFPIILSKAAKNNGTYVVAVALKEETDPELAKYVDKIYWISLGELKKLVDIFKNEKIKKAIMAGKVTKARFFKNKPKLDETAKGLLENVKDQRDASLLNGAARALRFFGITLVDSTLFLKDHLPPKGVLSKRQPTPEEWEDIKFGFTLAKNMGKLDIGQTAVVKNKAILAVEAIEGTDEAILRGGRLGCGSVVVVKTARPKQDKRFDMPTVGPKTVASLKAAGGTVLAIEAKKTLLLEKEKCIELIDSNNFSMVVV